MTGWVLLRANPYMAKTDRDGRFEIEHLPAGTHTFQLWHEQAGYLRNVRMGSLATDDRGRLTVMVEAGENQLGESRVGKALFEPH